MFGNESLDVAVNAVALQPAKQTKLQSTATNSI